MAWSMLEQRAKYRLALVIQQRPAELGRFTFEPKRVQPGADDTDRHDRSPAGR
jgi:hypothetical protein